MSDDRSVQMRSTWSVATRLPETARVIHALLGGESPTRGECEDSGWLVATRAETVVITIDSVDSIRFDMKQWIGGRLAHHCDTRVFLSPDEQAGTGCGCPTSVADLKAPAAAGRGPRPEVRVRFRLATAPDLGIFEYRTSGWTLLTDPVFSLDALLGRLAGTGGPALSSLENELVPPMIAS